jgi:hypothetical protein
MERVGHVVDLVHRDARLAQAVVDGVEGQLPGVERHRALAVLHVREALVLGGGDHHAVPHQARRVVVVHRVDSKRDHAFRSAAFLG